MTLPGPGDAATWPAYSGHPNDPRAPLGCADCDGDHDAGSPDCPWEDA